MPAYEVLETAFAKLKDELSEAEEDSPTLVYSQALNAAQAYYSTSEGELLADLKASDAFIVYMLGPQFTLRTDHAALSANFNSCLSSRSRVARWLLAMHPFRFMVNHVKGEESVVADRLSTIPSPLATQKLWTLSKLEADSKSFETRSTKETLIPKRKQRTASRRTICRFEKSFYWDSKC